MRRSGAYVFGLALVCVPRLSTLVVGSVVWVVLWSVCLLGGVLWFVGAPVVSLWGLLVHALVKRFGVYLCVSLLVDASALGLHAPEILYTNLRFISVSPRFLHQTLASSLSLICRCLSWLKGQSFFSLPSRHPGQENDFAVLLRQLSVDGGNPTFGEKINQGQTY